MSKPEFRAWSIKKQEFIDDVIHDGESWLEREGYETSSLSEIFDGDEFIVEQYTGIKDMSGKKIYEGDIILVANHGRTPYKVIYQDGDCSFVCNNEYILDYCNLFKSFHKCYSVIGNIHENHELLEANDVD